MEEVQESTGEEYQFYYLHLEDRAPFTVHVGVNGTTLLMEVDIVIWRHHY